MYLERLSFISTHMPAASGNWQAWNGGLFLAISKPTPGHRAGYFWLLLSKGKVFHVQCHQAKKHAVQRLTEPGSRPSSLKAILRCPLLAKIHITGTAKGRLV